MRAVTLGALAAGLAIALAGCGSSGFAGVYDLPLPGGADVGGHPYQVTARFKDVLDLVPQAAVKVNDVPVGRVTKIDLPANGWVANVVMLVNGDVRLPVNAIAWLRQSSLLGEKYVELGSPSTGAATARLANDAVIPVDRTSRSPQVEEVFGALSMLLNGGGIGQLQTITQQLNNALRGNEPDIRATLDNVNTLLSNLDAHRQHIADALDGLDRLSATLAVRDRQIGTVLDNLTPGLAVLDQQHGQLIGMLNALNTLSGVAVDTINASRDDVVADLQALEPTLRQLANAGQALPQALQVLLTYPFTDAVLGGIKGDYLNIYLSVTAMPGTTLTPPIPPPATAGQAVLPLPSITGTPTPGGGS